ncbi:MAG: hypothetical protein AAF436_04985 [Myxococcota bacterium]
MKAWNRYWFGDVALARPYLVLRFVLAALAFDVWLNMIPNGAKYGAGGFNVAHFPVYGDFVPGAAFYLGVLAFTGVLALSQALYRPHRIALAFVAVGYTVGWSCSLLDSVPYHYLLSLYLGCFVFFPMLSARAAFSRSNHAPRGSAWAYVSVCVTTAIVYFYMAAWGAASGKAYWLPMVCSGAYFVASMQDRSESQAVRVAMPLLGIAPIALHVTEPMAGWFSFYMIVIAICVFAPTQALHAAGRTLTFPVRLGPESTESGGVDERAARIFYASLIGLVVAPAITVFVDLPGVKTGCALTAIAMLLVMGRQLYLTPKTRPLWRVASLFGASVALFATMNLSTARFDFYREAAIDAETRGDADAAVILRDKVERYRR